MRRLFSTVWEAGLLLGGVALGLLALYGLGFGLALAGIPTGIPGLVFLVLGVGWAGFAYFAYRRGRQAEFSHLLTAAVTARLPLGPAVRAYAHDRPARNGPALLALPLAAAAAPLVFVAGAWAASGIDQLLGLFCVLLVPVTVGGLAWWWLWRRRFDRLAERFADLLDDGWPLADALRELPGLAPRELRVAAEVGEATGRMAESLRRADRDQLMSAWLELVPRVLYPLGVLVFVSFVTGFLMVMIVPKFKRIFDEFGTPLPDTTKTVIAVSDVFSQWSGLIYFGLLGAAFWVATLIVSPFARWHTPLIGWLYRPGLQGEVLRLLGGLVAADRTAPESLHLLADSRGLPGVARTRLARAAAAVERGEPLPDALTRAGLMPAAMAPLVVSATRTGNLPWALTELGEALTARSAQRIRRLSQLASPALLILVATTVGAIAVAMFLPLVALIDQLSIDTETNRPPPPSLPMVGWFQPGPVYFSPEEMPDEPGLEAEAKPPPDEEFEPESKPGPGP